MSPADPDRLARAARVERLVEAARPHLAGSGGGVVGHMRLRSRGRETEVLLGPHTRTDGTLAIIDWQTAPLAEVFFACAEDDDYEIEVEDGARTLAGTLLERHLVEVDAQGRLVEMAGSGVRLVRDAAGVWQEVPSPSAWLAPRDPAVQRRAETVEVQLDAAQRALVERPAGQALLVLGEAGYGKTTVALHRVARLARLADEAPESPGQRRFRAAVIVPTPGLRRLSALLLERLGATAVKAWLYDRFAAEQARQVFTALPDRESEDASAGVITLKRHPALRQAIAALLARGEPARAARPRKGRARADRDDLLLLFGDRPLMEETAAASGGTIGPRVVAEVLEHTHVQFSETTEEAFAHVDADRLQTLDARAIDEGTPMGDAGTVDAEDYAVLFELDRQRAARQGGRPAVPPLYDVLVVDEAQELAPLELALIGRSLAPGGTLVVAGDAAQQVDATTAFGGWPETLAELGARTYESATLEVSYRCPPEVTALARGVLGGLRAAAPDAAPASLAAAPAPTRVPGRPDPVVTHRLSSECHLVAQLIDALRALQGADPRATVAVIARNAPAARRLARLLDRGLTVRLVQEGDFDFRPGLVVTSVEEARGLEFDVVIVPDASPAAYPDTPEARRALYVAATRPLHQLALLTVGRWSPILAPLVLPSSR
jgi:hypothetical protein